MLLCDVDIVILKNPLARIAVELESQDLVFQHAGHENKPTRRREVNTGFFSARPSEKTIELFDTDVELLRSSPQFDDQALINAKLKQDGAPDCAILPEAEFPCGCYYLRNENHKRSAPYIVHYNYLLGAERKIAKMKEYGHWYVEQE